MREQLEAIIKNLREASIEIGKLPRVSVSAAEDNLDAASECIRDAMEELEEIIDREG